MKSIKNRLQFGVFYFLFWLVYFIFARFFFLMYYVEKASELGFLNLLKTFVYGIQLDASFTAYLCVIPFVLITFFVWLDFKKIAKIIQIYSMSVLFIINAFLLVDAGLYQAWGVRLDTSILPYFNTPKLMFASVNSFQIFTGIFFGLTISFVFVKIYAVLVHQKSKKIKLGKLIQIPIYLFFTACLVIPVRGGFQNVPVNQSNVYFSSNMFANHAAVNFIWNFFNTLTHKTDGTNPYKYFDDDVAKNIIYQSKNSLEKATIDSILTTLKPNIILILWESLSAKIVGSLGGESEVTPNLNQLSKEGILFANFYGNGDRTDKAIPAILSGYYPQPIKRIMRMPNKTRSLPMLPKKMQELGYTTSFYYGGDLNFGNMNTYLRNAGINHIFDGSEFEDKDWNSKWGAYDDVFMQRFAKDLSTKQQEPFFKIALTLSSHEPYEIKGAYKFGKKTEDNLYRSVHHYTDSVIGKFIEFSKTQSWYQNTLIVIMADHGHSSPKHEGPHFSAKKFKIPMLWLGGALHQKGIEISAVSSQVDFSYSLLKMLGGDASDFTFSKHIFNTSQQQYAHYVFNKGFGTITKNGFFLFDYVDEKPILKTGENTAQLDSLGKAITQISYQDFLERK